MLALALAFQNPGILGGFGKTPALWTIEGYCLLQAMARKSAPVILFLSTPFIYIPSSDPFFSNIFHPFFLCVGVGGGWKGKEGYCAQLKVKAGLGFRCLQCLLGWVLRVAVKPNHCLLIISSTMAGGMGTVLQKTVTMRFGHKEWWREMIRSDSEPSVVKRTIVNRAVENRSRHW